MQAIKKFLTKLFETESDPVHEINDIEELAEKLQESEFQANARNEHGDTFLHLLVKRIFKKRKLKLKAELVIGMLTYSAVDMDIPDNTGNTPLHTAVKAGEMEVVQALVAFNANINAVNKEGKTPLDLVPTSLNESEATAESLDANITSFLVSCGAKHHDDIIARPRYDFSEVATQQDNQDLFTHTLTCLEARLREKTKNVLSSLQEAGTPQAVELAKLITEMERLRRGGGRVLCLDGGGIRGLIQMEVLSQLEKESGKKVTELFDWIIGTSTGGIVALSLVYGQKSLHELRQFYFKTRYEVFDNVVGYDTDALNDILQANLGSYSLSDMKTPKVLVCAVDKSRSNLKFRFFNNCFDDEYSTQEVWKVARYTSAAPTFFKEIDDFVDGGILAQNPSALGLARIQEHYQEKEQMLPLSLVVSIGSGIPKDRELGSVDVQDYLSFGSHWFDLDHPKKFHNLLTIFEKALVYSEGAHYSTRINCASGDIPYFRFNPSLPEPISSGETDFNKLLLLMLTTKTQSGDQMGDLLDKLHQSVKARAVWLKSVK